MKKENGVKLFYTLFIHPMEFTDFFIVFREFLEHVGVDLLVPLLVFPDLVLADGNLSPGRPIQRVDLQHLAEVGHGQTELVTAETGLAPAIQRLLVRRVELNHLQ